MGLFPSIRMYVNGFTYLSLGSILKLSEFFTFVLIHVFLVLADEFPGIHDLFDGVLIPGSHYSVYENLPWMQQLKSYIRQVGRPCVPLNLRIRSFCHQRSPFFFPSLAAPPFLTPVHSFAVVCAMGGRLEQPSTCAQAHGDWILFRRTAHRRSHGWSGCTQPKRRVRCEG